MMVRNTAYQKGKQNTKMLMVQCQIMGRRQKYLKSYNVQKYEKIKDNFILESTTT